jgi:2'-5' RNA ligase
MGHTVVLGFDNDSNVLLHELLEPFGANKIPFGRRCNREEANKVMDYHMTLYHWPKTMDTYCLSRLNGFQSIPCHIQVNGMRIMQAEENSWLLYFEVSPTETFTQLKLLFEKHTGFCISGFYHITLAVGKDYNEIAEIRDYIWKNQVFPFELTADRMDLYKIWSPTQKIMSL